MHSDSCLVKTQQDWLGFQTLKPETNNVGESAHWVSEHFDSRELCGPLNDVFGLGPAQLRLLCECPAAFLSGGSKPQNGEQILHSSSPCSLLFSAD